MYDTQFFQKTYELKQQIIAGKKNSLDWHEIFDEFERLRRRQPMVFNIETTSYCNMKCVMCQRTTDMQRKPSHMSMEVFQRIVEQMPAMPATQFEDWQRFVDSNLRTDSKPSENNFYFDVVANGVTLHGFGEPLLDPLLPERVAMLREKNINSYFSANPCNIKLPFIKKLFEAGVSHIKFAMDSLDDDVARKIRGGPADFTESYRKVLEVLKLKKDMKAETTIVMTMLDMSGDPAVLPSFIDLWKDKDVYAYGKSIDNQWLLKTKEKAEAKTAAEASNKSHYQKQYCEFPWTSVTIMDNGNVVPCTQDINCTWTFGNVMEQSLEEIWNGKKFDEFRKLHMSKDYPQNFMCHEKCDLNLLSYFYSDRDSE
ncbi:radical SAM/SPASM domain-containing protein [Maridesulfovibrio sp.]|uniref:radical SAM/SPASM domain-containing protein n=1 Tax=Maridesulfovibrio sp. TaxID=2795000 RepID=UPI002A1873A1|nr:radical SAM/SPASM domain-containing protein [Maridesulfovibrio sp.]